MAKILVADDEELVRNALRQMLEGAGHDVLEATNGVQTLSCVQQEQVDLVIIDIFMPHKEGLETIVDLQRNWPDLKLVAISGGGALAQVEVLDMATALGASHTIRKPLEVEKVLAIVASALEQET